MYLEFLLKFRVYDYQLFQVYGGYSHNIYQVLRQLWVLGIVLYWEVDEEKHRHVSKVGMKEGHTKGELDPLSSLGTGVWLKMQSLVIDEVARWPHSLMLCVSLGTTFRSRELLILWWPAATHANLATTLSLYASSRVTAWVSWTTPGCDIVPQNNHAYWN